MTLETEIDQIIEAKIAARLDRIANPIRLLDENEAMQILACDKTTLRGYRAAGLAFIQTRPRKYTLKDIEEFIASKRKKFA